MSAFTDKELAFLQAHAEFWRRPHDWSEEHAADPVSTFAPVRHWLAKVDTLHQGTLRMACERVARGKSDWSLAAIREAYWTILREARLAVQQAKAAAGQHVGLVGCMQCIGRGFLVLPYVVTRRGRKRLVTLDSPAAGRWYEILIPCSCDLGQSFAADHGCDLHGEHLNRARALAWNNMEAMAKLRRLCGTVEPEAEGAIDDATAAEVAGDPAEQPAF